MIRLNTMFPSWQKRADRVLDQLLRHLLAHDVSGMSSLFASDGILELPLATAAPRDRAVGRDAIARRLAELVDRFELRGLITERRHYGARGKVVWEIELCAIEHATTSTSRIQRILVVDLEYGEIASLWSYEPD